MSICQSPRQGDYVWVVDQATKTVSRRNVKRGGILPDGGLRILEGLQPGETVAVSGLRFLSDGMKVELSESV